MCLIFFFWSIIKRPLSEAPYKSSEGSSTRTWKSLDISFEKSESKGISRSPSPPSVLEIFFHARCVKWESTETATTSVLRDLNSLAAFENEMISVGQTYVKSKG